MLTFHGRYQPFIIAIEYGSMFARNTLVGKASITICGSAEQCVGIGFNDYRIQVRTRNGIEGE